MIIETHFANVSTLYYHFARKWLQLLTLGIRILYPLPFSINIVNIFIKKKNFKFEAAKEIINIRIFLSSCVITGHNGRFLTNYSLRVFSWILFFCERIRLEISFFLHIFAFVANEVVHR